MDCLPCLRQCRPPLSPKAAGDDGDSWLDPLVEDDDSISIDSLDATDDIDGVEIRSNSVRLRRSLMLLISLFADSYLKEKRL